MNNKDCISDVKLISYIENDFQHEDAAKIEKHFFNCETCTNKARNYIEINSISNILSKSTQTKNKRANASIDTLSLTAASSPNVTSSEVRSSNGKYLMKSSPFLEKNSTLVEVQVLDGTQNGTLVIENQNETLFKSKLYNGVACDEIDGRQDFRNVFISIIDD